MAERTIGAGEFKAKCLALLDEVAKTGDTLIITKRGKPVAKLVGAQTAVTAGPGILGFYANRGFEGLLDVAEESGWDDDMEREQNEKFDKIVASLKPPKSQAAE
jgi:prevent-host-death family protein